MSARIAARGAFLASVLLFTPFQGGTSTIRAAGQDSQIPEAPASPAPPAAPQTDAAEATVPLPAPTQWQGQDFEYRDIRGGQHKLSENAGHVVLLEFWAPWSTPSRKAFPFLDQLQADHAAKGLRVVAVTLEPEDGGVVNFIKDFPGMRFVVGQDRSARAGDLMDVTTLPTTFVLDQQGKVLARFEGGGEAVLAQVELTVESVLGGTPPAPAASPGKQASLAPASLAAWQGRDFQFQDIHGGAHKLSENAGHVVLLEFWAPWCIPCRKGFPFLDQLQARHQTDGLKVVAVTLETEDQGVMDFIQDFPGMRFLVGQDRSAIAGDLMEVAAMPTSFLLDRQGKVLARFEGGSDATHQQVEQAVQAVLSGASLALPASAGKQAAGPKGNLKAWERGYLADPIMSLDGDVLKRSMRDHIHASKEAAAGDGGVAGGGCGCN